MRDLDFQIDRLRLDLSGVGQHSHRVPSIAERAASLFAERLDAGWSGASSPQTPGQVEVNLQNMSDDEAAKAIAEGWLRSISPRLAL